jgi:hypothetical protein
MQKEQLIAKIKELSEALKFYAEGDNVVLLTGLKDGKPINWNAEQDVLESKGFRFDFETYNSMEQWLENGTTARTALEKAEDLISELEDE